MDLVDEQHVARLQVGEDGGQVGRPLQHRPGGLPQADAQLDGQNVGQGGLAQSRRPEDQHVVERLAPLARRSHENLELRLYGSLPDIFIEAGRPDGPLDRLVLAACRAADDSFGFQ